MLRGARAVAAVGVLAVSASAAQAQMGRVLGRSGSGARAAGMANAFIAISDDGTAASWNPAGLGQLRRPELSIVATTAHLAYLSEGFRTRDDLSVFSPMTADYTSSYLDFGSLAIPVTIGGKPVTLQAAWRRLYTLDFRENASTFRTPLGPEGPPPLLIEGNTDVVGGFSLFSIAGAVKLTPRLAVGGSFNLWRADWRETEFLAETPLDGSGPARFGMTARTSRVRAHGLSLGILLTYPRWSLGLLRQSGASGDFTGTEIVRRSGEPAAAASPLAAVAHFPQSLGLGLAWRPASRWTVAVDLTWDEWSRTFLDPEDGARVDLFNGLPPELAATRNTLSTNLGAECLLHGDGFVVPLRFGAAREPQGPRSPFTRDPVVFEMLAAGAGYNTNSLKLDAAVQYRWGSVLDGANFGLDPGSSLTPRSVGERSADEWRIKISLILRASDTEKVRRTLRRIFGGG